jgi:sulfite exporter TauE/SafE
MADHSLMFAALCDPNGVPGGWTLFLTLFVAGLAGGVTHCAPMCGPFVLAQVSENWAKLRPSQLCSRQRLRQGVLLPYHAGRLLTYAGLGALAAGSGAALGAVPGLSRLPAVLLLIGAMLLLSQAIKRLVPANWRLRGLSPNLANLGLGLGALARSAGRIDRSRPLGGFLFGVVLGFLPCGFLYAALSVAASSADAGTGALAMLAFGLGTAPNLIGLGIAGQAIGRNWGTALASAGPFLLLLNAAVLGAMAWQRLVVLG